MLASRWSHLVRHGLIGGSLLAAATGTAHADSCDDIADSTIAFVLGVQVAPTTKLVGGIEGRRCIAHNSEAMIRLELGGGSPRLIGGVRARPFEKEYEDGDLELLGVEAGLVLDMQARFGLHLAGTFGTHSAYGAIQAHLSLADPVQPARYSVVAGFAPWTAFQYDKTVVGRPVVAAGEMLRPRIAKPLATLASAEARAVRDHFVASAQLELSSVWTFLRLAAELAAAGAPQALIAAALDAADDEVRHAELCATLAGGVALAALPAHVAKPRFATPSGSAFATLVAEAWSEGCLNETAAAEEARLAAEDAHGDAKHALAAIAHDETRHAELSWAVLDWVQSIAPELTAATLASLPPGAPATSVAVDPALSRHGVPRAEVISAARAHAETSARTRLAAIVT